MPCAVQYQPGELVGALHGSHYDKGQTLDPSLYHSLSSSTLELSLLRVMHSTVPGSTGSDSSATRISDMIDSSSSVIIPKVTRSVRTSQIGSSRLIMSPERRFRELSNEYRKTLVHIAGPLHLLSCTTSPLRPLWCHHHPASAS